MFTLDQFQIKTVSEDNMEGVFEIAPLPRGYGQTLGNTLRRILLSAIPGSAVTRVKFANVQHEYSTLPDVKDDVLSIVLRLKNLPVNSNTEEPVTLFLNVKGKKGESTIVRASDIDLNTEVELIDPDFVITELTGDTELSLEIVIEKGTGYVGASDEARNEIGVIPLDADFCPVKNVSMDVVQTRVGQRTDLDKIKLTVKTNGSVKPSVVLHQSSQVLGEMSTHLLSMAEDALTAEPQGLIGLKTEKVEEKDEVREPIVIADLGLSNRLTNALLRSGYTDLYELEGMAEEEVNNIKGMGSKSLSELKSTLNKYNIELI